MLGRALEKQNQSLPLSLSLSLSLCHTHTHTHTDFKELAHALWALASKSAGRLLGWRFRKALMLQREVVWRQNSSPINPLISIADACNLGVQFSHLQGETLGSVFSRFGFEAAGHEDLFWSRYRNFWFIYGTLELGI